MLETLAGTVDRSTITITGSIRLNGMEQKQIQMSRNAILVSSHDASIPNLTVRENVEFVYDCLIPRGRGEFLESVIRERDDVESQQQWKELEEDLMYVHFVLSVPCCVHFLMVYFWYGCRSIFKERKVPDLIMSLLGILHCSDTRVGSPLLRGVSGGERRRTSLAQGLVGYQPLIFLDNITNGLDSATAFVTVRLILRAMKTMKKTGLLALLQPAPEVMELFDDVIILSEGHVLYHGPVQSAVSWFSDLGYRMPLRKDPCSFLIEVTTEAGQIKFGKAERAEDRILSSKTLSNMFWNEHPVGISMRDMISNSKEGNTTVLRKSTKYPTSIWRLFLNVYRRQRDLVSKMKLFFIARIAQALLMGLLRGSMFWMIPATPAGGRLILSSSVMTIVFVSLLSGPQLELVAKNRNVFMSERVQDLYPRWALVISFFLTQIPQSILETVVFSVTLYFMSGYERSAAAFFKFYLITFLASLNQAAMTRSFAFAIPSKVLAAGVMSMVLLVLTMTNGFNILRDNIPKYIIWIYYANPSQYGVSALSVNELTSPRWNIPYGNSSEPLGIQVLQLYQFPTDPNWFWVSTGFLCGYLIIVLFLSVFFLQFSPRSKKKIDMDSSQTKATNEDTDIQTAMHERQPIALVFKNICYSVPRPKSKTSKTESRMLELLDNISFYAKPGDLVALMGGSGAGKTTLMDVVCGRKTMGEISGEIFCNGIPQDQVPWKQMVGYVEQDILHSPQLTVFEALYFSARLRLYGADEVMALGMVDQVLSLTELGPQRHAITGTQLGDGLSLEAQKRLSIGVELVANPSIIFLDEPTTGLDARSAAIVIDCLHAISRTQRTVMVTVHQPSMDIFESFDQLILLKRGGKPIYCGPLGKDSVTMVTYFESCEGVEKIGVNYNPATWMLEVTGSAPTTIFKASNIDFHEHYLRSDLFKENEMEISTLLSTQIRKGDENPMAKSRSKYNTDYRHRYWAVLWKVSIIYWRTPSYAFARLLLVLLVAILYGLVYLNQGRPDQWSQASVQNILGLFYSMSVFIGNFNAINVLSLLQDQRSVYYRELFSAMYGPWSYTVATGLAEIPYLAVQTIIMSGISYWMVGFSTTAWKFFYFMLMFLTGITCYTFMGQMLAFIMPSLLLGLLCTTLVSQIWTVLNGYIIPYSQIPIYWKWMNRISPPTWILYGLGTSQLGDNDEIITGPDGQQTTVSEFIEDFYGYNYSFIWQAWLIVLAFAIGFKVIGAISLRYISHDQR